MPTEVSVSQLIENALGLDWGYILSTLVIRFFGVFLVLAILMVGMMILGAVVSRLVAAQETRKTSAVAREKEAARLAESPETNTGDEELAAVIGAAIAFSMEPVSYMQSLPHEAVSNGSWVLAGRMALMGRRLPAGTQRRTQ